MTNDINSFIISNHLLTKDDTVYPPFQENGSRDEFIQVMIVNVSELK